MDSADESPTERKHPCFDHTPIPVPQPGVAAAPS